MSVIATNADRGAEAIAPENGTRFPVRRFEPHPFFRNPHLATVAAACWPRDYSNLPAATERLFEGEPGTRPLAKCHWQGGPCPSATLGPGHGPGGSRGAPYLL